MHFFGAYEPSNREGKGFFRVWLRSPTHPSIQRLARTSDGCSRVSGIGFRVYLGFRV